MGSIIKAGAKWKSARCLVCRIDRKTLAPKKQGLSCWLYIHSSKA